MNQEDINKLLSQKVEEPTLYLINQEEDSEKKFKEQQGRIEKLEKQVELLLK